MAEESVGTIIDSENKILTPVYIYTDSSSSTLPTTPSSSKAGFGVAGGIYNGNFYGIAVNPEGKISTITWNRTSDPVIGNTDLVVVNPGTGQNPLASGYNVSLAGASKYTDSDFNILTINEVDELSSGDYGPLDVLLGVRHDGSNPFYYHWINLKIINNTSKSLTVTGFLKYIGAEDLNTYDFSFNSETLSSKNTYSVVKLTNGTATNASTSGNLLNYTLSLNFQVLS